MIKWIISKTASNILDTYKYFDHLDKALKLIETQNFISIN